ncbi:hypothetical protein V2G26_017412 [Clonostachys chloroleuca]
MPHNHVTALAQPTLSNGATVRYALWARIFDLAQLRAALHHAELKPGQLVRSISSVADRSELCRDRPCGTAAARNRSLNCR